MASYTITIPGDPFTPDETYDGKVSGRKIRWYKDLKVWRYLDDGSELTQADWSELPESETLDVHYTDDPDVNYGCIEGPKVLVVEDDPYNDDWLIVPGEPIAICADDVPDEWIVRNEEPAVVVTDNTEPPPIVVDCDYRGPLT